MVDVDAFGERGGVVGAEEGAVGVGAEAEVSDAHFELCPTDDVGDGCRNAGVDLCGIVNGRVVFVEEVDEEDAGDERRGG